MFAQKRVSFAYDDDDDGKYTADNDAGDDDDDDDNEDGDDGDARGDDNKNYISGSDESEEESEAVRQFNSLQDQIRSGLSKRIQAQKQKKANNTSSSVLRRSIISASVRASVMVKEASRIVKRKRTMSKHA